MKLSRTKNTVKNIAFGSAYKVIAIFLPFIIRTITLYVLGIEYLGLNSLFTSILNVLTIAELGFGTALVYSMYKPLAEDDTSKVNALLNLYKKIYRYIGFIVLGLGIAVMPFLKHLINGTYPPTINLYLLYSIYLFNSVIGYFCFAYKNSILVAQQRNDIVSKVNILTIGLLYIVQIVVLLAFKNYYVYIAFLPLSTLATNLLIHLITQKRYNQFKAEGEISKAEKKAIKKQITALFTHRIGYVIQSSIDNLCISAFLGLILLGRYNNYFYVITAVESFITLAKQSMLAGIGNSVATESVEYNKNTFNKLTFINMWIIGWCSCCLLCLYQPFIQLWVGPENMLKFTVVICLVLLFYTSNIRAIVGMYKDALGMWWQDRFKPIAISIVNLIGTIICARLGFFEGIILSTTVSYLLIGLPWETLVLFKNYFKQKPTKYYLQIAWHTLINAIAAIITFVLYKQIEVYGIYKFVVGLILCFVIPNTIYMLVYWRNSKFKAIKELFMIKMGGRIVKILKKILGKIKRVLCNIISLIFYLFPIDKTKIIAYNFNGNGYGGNSKYLCNELLKHNKYKIIWICKNINSEFPQGITPVKYGSLKALYHVITARLWLDNVRNNPKPLFKRRSQYYIQMWHAGVFIKGQEKDAESTLSKTYIRYAKQDGRLSDWILSNCKKRTELIKNAYWYDGEVLEFGIPRNDILYDLENEEIAKLKDRHNLQDKKIVLYAPSFRKDKSFYNGLVFDVEQLLAALKERFGEEYTFCYRLHPNDQNIKVMFNNPKYIDLTKESDSQLVLAASEIVISDYSSMSLDFALTGRLALNYAPDYDNYINTDRKLYIDLKTCGIPFAETFDGLINNIKTFDEQQYAKELDKLYGYYEMFDNKNSSNKIIKFLIEKGVL